MTEAAIASRDCSSTQVYVPDQAFTHLALIDAGLRLNDALDATRR